MAVICPTVTTDDPHVYRQQVEKVAAFANRIHIDLADGILAPIKLLSIDKLWIPDDLIVDIHLMYQDPASVVDKIIELKPNLLVFHAEADGNFAEIASKLQSAGVKVGLALLASTEVDTIKDVICSVDHVLVFSGNLGYFGGTADLELLDKVSDLKQLKPELEVGWDGGINDYNAKGLTQGGVDVLNVGGYIQKSEYPEKAYATLMEAIKK